MKRFLLITLLCVLPACAVPPPNLSPAAVTAFQNTRVIKGLDILRDTAVDANAQVPPQLSTATTRKVVQYHESALKIIHAAGSGWQAAVLVGLDELVKDAPPAERSLLAPYVALVHTILAGVQ